MEFVCVLVAMSAMAASGAYTSGSESKLAKAYGMFFGAEATMNLDTNVGGMTADSVTLNCCGGHGVVKTLDGKYRWQCLTLLMGLNNFKWDGTTVSNKAFTIIPVGAQELQFEITGPKSFAILQEYEVENPLGINGILHKYAAAAMNKALGLISNHLKYK